MAEKKALGPAGDATKGVLGKPTVADQLEAEKAARARQDQMGWEPVKVARKGGPEGATPKALSRGQARDLARRIAAKLGRKG